MKRLAIIADDYTGSNDTGVQFAKKGLKTLVTSEVDALFEIDNQIDVIVLNTTSRADDARTAYQKVYRATDVLKQIGVNYIYKKLDSTLRGNIGAEIAGAMDAGGYSLAVVAPALPSNGRTTIGGNQLVHGVALERTEIAKDPVAPVNYSYVPYIIQEQTEKRVSAVNLQDVLRGSARLVEVLQDQVAAGVEILVLDSITQADLDLIAESLQLLDQECLLVGSAGFAESVPTAFGLLDSKLPVNCDGSVVAIAGSVSDVTRGQIAYAEENWKVEVVDIDLRMVLGDDAKQELARVVDRVKRLIATQQDVIIRSARTRDLVTAAREIGQEYGLSHLEVSQKIAYFLGSVAKGIYGTEGLRGLFLTGGDIAIQCASLIGAKATLIEAELLPGVPVGTFVGDNLPPVPIVTKAGAFGAEDTFVQIFSYLKRRGSVDV